MPWASVSEKPTRVSAEYLNGGLRSVTRPSSSVIRTDAKRRKSFAARPVAHRQHQGPAHDGDDGAAEDGKRNDRIGGVDVTWACRARSLARSAWIEVRRGRDAWVLARGREGGGRDQLVDEPAAAHSVDVDLERDCAERFGALGRLQHQLGADLVSVDVVDRPRMVRSPSRIRIDGDLAVRRL